MDGQDTKWRRNIAENFNRMSRAHERYRQTTDRQMTDGRPMTYRSSEHELFSYTMRSIKRANCNLLVEVDHEKRYTST